jgi:pimeloyl-ACP methyl ester carboxylesterase
MKTLSLMGLVAVLTMTTVDSPAASDLANETQTRYRTVEVEGLNIFYREAGRKNAPTIVLLHGSPASSHMFRDLLPLLADSFRVIAPDYVGFGHSDTPSPEKFSYTFENLARITGRFLEELELKHYALYMQDYGGPIGFRVAMAHPERVAGLVIQNANAYVEGIGTETLAALQPLWEKRTPETEARVRPLLSPEGVRAQYVAGASRPDAVGPDGWLLEQALLQQPHRIALELDLLADYRSNLSQYHKWQAYFRAHRPKTLIVWGEDDPIFIPAGAKAYKRDLPEAELVWLNGGHFALEEHAAEIAGRIKQTFK